MVKMLLRILIGISYHCVQIVDMSTRRTVRVSEAVRMELANLFTRERSLEGIILTISSVDVTPDLKNAHIFLSVLEHALSQESILALLNKKRYEWQSTIAHRLQLKFTPRLIFKFDASLERGDRVMQILNELELNTPPVKEPQESEE